MASVGKVVVKGERRLYQLKKGIVATGKHDSYKVVGCLGSGGFGAMSAASATTFSPCSRCRRKLRRTGSEASAFAARPG